MATLLKERSTYWVFSGGSSAHKDGDYRCYWKIYYEQTDADKKLLRTKLIIDYYLQFSNPNVTSITYDDSTTSQVYVNGASIGGISISFSSIGNTGLIKKGSKTTYVYHDKTTGEGSFTFRGTGFGLGTSTTTYNLPKINVGTEITNNSTSSNHIDLDTDVTFTLNDLTGQVEANKLYYKINNTEYVITDSTMETSVKYSFPVDIINNFPNNEKISLTVYCKNLVNNVETTTTVYLKLPDSYVPSASLSVEDVMSNKPSVLEGLWLKNQSKLRGTITANGVKGSKISSYLSSISQFSQQYNTNPFTTQALSVTGTRSVSTTVTDSRGRNRTVTKTIEVIDYAKPTFVSLVVKRCLQDGTITETGTYAKVICKYNISPINNLNTKTLIVKLNNTLFEIPLTNYSDEVSAVAFTGISQASSYNITATLTDLFGSISQDYLLGIAYKTVSKRAGGKGVTIGQVATEDGFNVYMDSDFKQKLTKNGKNVATEEFVKNTISDDKNMLMGCFNKTISITSTVHNKITLTESVKVGDKLSISNGGVLIGTGVTIVEVSGNVYFSNGMNDGDSIRSFIYKNDEAIVHNFNRCNGTYEDRPISPFLVSVTAGDILYLYGSNATSGRGTIADNSYLVVKVIE